MSTRHFWKVALLIGVGIVGYKIFQNYQKMSMDSCENDNASEDDATEENQEDQPDADTASVNTEADLKA